MKKTFISLVIIFSFGMLNAQTTTTLTEKEKKDLKILAREYVDEFEQNLQLIPKMTNSEVRTMMTNRLLNKFMPNAKIETAGQHSKQQYYVKDYLKRVLRRYGKKFRIVNIEIVSIKFDNIVPVEGKPGYYKLHYEFTQKYCRSNSFKDNEGIIHYDYCDETTKSGDFIIKKITDAHGTRWRLFYGDINVTNFKLLL